MGCKMPKKKIYIYPIIGTSNLLTNIYGEFLRIMEYVIVKSNFKNKKGIMLSYYISVTHGIHIIIK